MPRAYVFINGIPPKTLPEIGVEDFVLCTDGAYEYLKDKEIEIDVVLGDLDSVEMNIEKIRAKEIVYAYDQDFTDFQKALNYLHEKNFTEIWVFGGAGKEQDHFLGNLTAAVEWKDRMQITFFEPEYYFRFTENEEWIQTEVGKIISLYPFPEALKVETLGLKYPLNGEDLNQQKRIGIRNTAVESPVHIKYERGELLLFVYF